jgi:hypothetical protein
MNGLIIHAGAQMVDYVRPFFVHTLNKTVVYTSDMLSTWQS